MFMAENELKKLSKDYASGKIKTDEYREERKRLIDDITKVERPTPTDSSQENKREFSKGPIYLFLWFLGLVGAISILIVALKMGKPEQSPQATIATIQTTANPITLSSPIKLEDQAQSIEKKTIGTQREKKLETDLDKEIIYLSPNESTAEATANQITDEDDAHNGSVVTILPIAKKVFQDPSQFSEKSEKEKIAEFGRNKEICDNNWLADQDPERYTLQLCVLSNETNVQRLLEEYADLNLKAVRFEDKGPVWIIYGIFDTYDQADEHSGKLAENLKSSINGNGVIIKISSIQDNME